MVKSLHVTILSDLAGYDSKVQLQPEQSGLPASVRVSLSYCNYLYSAVPVMFVHHCILFSSSSLMLAYTSHASGD